MTVSIPYTVAAADGLREQDRPIVLGLLNNWSRHLRGNMLRNDYYEMNSMLKDLGISVPDSLKNLEVACGWGYKTVEVMRDHIAFDGFSMADGEDDEALRQIAKRNSLATRVGMAANSALKYCFTMWVVTDDGAGRARVSAYPPTLATGLWNDVTMRLDAGMFVVRFRRERGVATNEPDWVDVMLPDCLIRIREVTRGRWAAEYAPHALGVVPMFVMPYNPDDDRPFGTSRITPEVRWLIDCAVRENVNEEIASAFAASTQKYLLGTDGDAFEDTDRWSAFIGSILEVSLNSDGGTPTFGQLAQPSMQPLTDHFNNLCKRMSAATGIHVGQFGIMSDNPSSAEAMYAEQEPLILKCKSFIKEMKAALVRVCTAALATEYGTSYAEAEASFDISANFLNPSMPTLAQQTDSSVKLASVLEGFAETRTFLRMNGFDDDEVRDITSELRLARGRRALEGMIAPAGQDPEANDDQQAGVP